MSSRKERRKAKKGNDRLRDEAWEAVEHGRPDFGLRLIQRAIARAPGNARYWYEQGRILARRGRIGPALDSFSQAVELSPRYVAALRALAALAADRGETEREVRALATLAEVEPGDEEARARLERLLAGRSRREGPAEPDGEHPATGPDPERSPFTPRTQRYDWDALEAELTRRGCCILPGLLERQECAALIALERSPELFEHEVAIGDRGGGDSRYRFFARPLPDLVQELRSEVYARLAPIANRWNELLGRRETFPPRLDAFLERCRAAGQTRTTPLLFRYERGASNHFHRDLAGRVYFPLQLVVTLGPASAADGGGNEFLLADVCSAKRERTRALRPGVGDGVLFCTRDRLQEVAGVVGLQPVKHGVTPLLGERRYALGVPFHDYR